MACPDFLVLKKYFTLNKNLINTSLPISQTIPLPRHLFNPIFFGLILLLVIGLSGCQKSDTTKPASKSTQNATSQTATTNNEILLLNSDVTTATAERYQPHVMVTGTLQVANKTPVQAMSNAQVAQVLVKVGDSVKKGQRLIITNLEDSRNKLAQAQADLNGSLAQAAVAQSLANKNKILLEKGFVAQIEYERSLADAHAQNEAVKAKQAQLNIVQKMYGDMNITAPMTGVIASRRVEAGQVVSAGQTLLEIVDPSQLEFAASVPIEAQSYLAIGQSVPFTINSDTTRYVGQISRIAPEVDANTRQLTIYVTVKPDQNSHQLKAGMFATGTLEYGQIQLGVLLPSSAVMLDNTAPANANSSAPTLSTTAGTPNLDNSFPKNNGQKDPSQKGNGEKNNGQKGYVWLVGQDHRLTRQPIEILQRYENTGQFLVAGVPLTAMVVLVPLSANDAGKVVTVK